MLDCDQAELRLQTAGSYTSQSLLTAEAPHRGAKEGKPKRPDTSTTSPTAVRRQVGIVGQPQVSSGARAAVSRRSSAPTENLDGG